MSADAAVGTGSGTPTSARRPGFMADVAAGIAGALLSAPELAASALLVAALCLPTIPVGICAAHAAGIALARLSTKRRLAIVAGWIGLAALRSVSLAGAWEFGPDSGAHQALALAQCAISLAWAARSRAVWIGAIVVAAAAEFAVWRPWWIADAGSHTVLGAGDFRRRMDMLLIQLGAAAAVFLLVALGRRGWTIAAIVVAAAITVAVLLMSGGSAVWTGPPENVVWSAVYMACVFGILLLPVVGGLASRAAERGVADDDGARFVLALVRRPWRAALAIGVVLVATVNIAGAFLPGGDDPASRFALLGRTTSASALLAMLASGAAGAIGALAPVLTASAFALLAWIVSSLLAGSHIRDDLIAHRAVRSAAYLLPQLLAHASLVPAAAIARLTMPLVLVAVVLPPAAWSTGVDASPWTGLAWIVVVTATSVAVAAGDRPAAQIVTGAVVLGLVQRLALEFVPVRVHAQLLPPSWSELPVAWMLAAAFVVIGRRARSMTAIPLDHAVFVDFARTA